MEEGRKIQLDQRTKAESDYAVAAASIIAREGFINWLDRHEKDLEIPLPKGVSAKVKESATRIISTYGPDMLRKTAKIHFKTAAEVLP